MLDSAYILGCYGVFLSFGLMTEDLFEIREAAMPYGKIRTGKMYAEGIGESENIGRVWNI